MERFYTFQKLDTHEWIELTDTEHHHLSHVLRIRENQEIHLVNGKGSLALGKVGKIGKKSTSIQILSIEHTPRSETQICLGLPFMRPSKLEWVFEKGTEIGCDAFFLYPADRSTQDSLSEHQIERLQTITISAMKQSKRLYIPHIEITPHLKNLLSKDGTILFGDTRPLTSPVLETKENTTTFFITGPESGFSPEEIALLSQKAIATSLNANVLRCETAPIVALSILCMKKRLNNLNQIN